MMRGTRLASMAAVEGGMAWATDVQLRAALPLTQPVLRTGYPSPQGGEGLSEAACS